MEVAIYKYKRWSVVLLIAFILVLLLLIFPDAAHATSYYTGTDETGRQYDVTDFASGIHAVYNIARVVAIALAAVAAAAGALQMLAGNEEAASKGRTQIIMAALVIAALALLPTVVKFGVDVGRQYGWTPTIEEGNQFDTTLVTDGSGDSEKDDSDSDDKKNDNKETDDEKSDKEDK